MDGKWVDRLARAMARVRSRRGVIGGAASGIAPLLGPPSVLACKNVGKKCYKNNDCCDGARCKGGKNGKCRCKNGFTKCGKRCRDLDKDREHCGVCGNACVSPDACCDGVCSLTCAK
jgi:hypothetical protein